MMENVLLLLAQLLATDLPGIQTHPKHSQQCTQAISLLEYLSGIYSISNCDCSPLFIQLYFSHLEKKIIVCVFFITEQI